MKFLELTFQRFGPFEECKLDFTQSSGLQIIHGLNEAGKSSALRGIQALLFKFPAQSGDDFRFKYNEFRIRAKLCDNHGRELECVRRKGNKDTLRLGDDKTLFPDPQWDEFLGGMTKEKFEQHFGLDAQRLLAGSEEIKLGKGDLGRSLFEAGAGLRGLRALSTHLEEVSAKLCKPSMRSGEIPSLTADHRNHTQKIRECLLSPEIYSTAVSDAESAERETLRLNSERRDLRLRVDRLTRYQSALPTIEQLDKKREELRLREAAALLPDDFEDVHRQAIVNQRLADSGLQNSSGELTKYQKQLSELPEPDAILEHEEEIGQLTERFATIDYEQSDHKSIETSRSREEGQAQKIFQELADSTNWKEMENWILRLDQRERIHELADQYSGVAQAVGRENGQVEKLLGDLSNLENELASAVAPIDTSVWEALVSEIIKQGPLEDNAAKKNLELGKTANRLRSEFGQWNPSFRGNWDTESWTAAEPLRLPSRKAIDEFSQELQAANKAVEEAADTLHDTGRQIDDVRSQSIDHESGEPVATFASLKEARQDRNDGLRLVRRRLEGHSTVEDEAGFIAKHATGRNMMDAVEATVRDSDAIADRLRLDANRVAKAEVFQKQLELLNARKRGEEAALQQAIQLRDNVQSRWMAAWSKTGVQPLSPGVMLDWLKTWLDWLDRRAEYQNASLEHGREVVRIAALRTRLITECHLDQDTNTLALAIKLAQVKIERNNELRTEYQGLQREIHRKKSDIATARQQLKIATEGRDRWNAEWRDAIEPLRIHDANPSVDTVRAYVQRHQQMREHIENAQEYADKIQDIDDRLRRFLDRVNAVRTALEPSASWTTSESLHADFRELTSRLRSAMETQSRRQGIEKNVASEMQAEAALRLALDEANAKLEALRQQSGAATLDEIPGAIQASREKAKVSDSIRDSENVLVANLRGEPLDDFIAAAREHGQSIEATLAQLKDDQERLDQQIREAGKREDDFQEKLAEYQLASDAAANAQQQVRLLETRLTERAMEYAAIQCARSALEKAKERYRQKNQDDMLSKASRYFQMLTDGAFDGVDIDNEEGTEVLKAVRAIHSDRGPLVPIEGLSDGTRDQLFLALRLAGIDNHLTGREPFPLIVDDALINFDDNRTRATLACLAELAKRTQVLIFTHHQHVVDFAREVDHAACVQPIN